MNFMMVPGTFGCITFLFSVGKVLLISSATVSVHAGRSIWLNHLATVLFNVRSAISVERCALYPCFVCVFGMFAVI